MIIANSSVLSSDIELFADESNITLSNDIRKTIRGLDFDKVHGHNMRVFTCWRFYIQILKIEEKLRLFPFVKIDKQRILGLFPLFQYVGKSLKAVFLGISKVFDKVWHQGEILKLKQNGISGILLNIAEDVLANR